MKFTTRIKPPPINQKLKRGKSSRLYVAREYMREWGQIEQEWKSQAFRNPFVNPVSVVIETGWNQYDIDALIKQTLDSLQGLAYTNDRQVQELTVVRIKDKRLTVFVEECN
jgi:Holliday junction resolvase RusA-like endonuclease